MWTRLSSLCAPSTALRTKEWKGGRAAYTRAIWSVTCTSRSHPPLPAYSEDRIRKAAEKLAKTRTVRVAVSGSQLCVSMSCWQPARSI